jgi:hypothetical protein
VRTKAHTLSPDPPVQSDAGRSGALRAPERELRYAFGDKMNENLINSCKPTDRTRMSQSDLYEAIGVLSSEFGGLELTLIDKVVLLINSSNDASGQVVVDKLSFSQTVDLFDRLLKRLVTDRARLRRGSELVKTLRDLSDARNDILHSAWIATSPDEYRQIRPRKKKKGMTTEERLAPDPSFIHDVIEKVIRTGLQLGQFLPGSQRYRTEHASGG